MSRKNKETKRMEIEPLLVKKDISIKEAMRKMDEAGEKILFIVDDNLRLLGSLTDGDIRRWILSDRGLKEKVEQVFNKQPIFVRVSYPIDTVKKLMINEKIERIPATDNSGKIVDVYLWENIFGEDKEAKVKCLDIPVVIMGGGKGARLDPFTRILPKPLIPVGEKPIAEIIMDNFNKNGCSNFYLIIGYKGEMIKSYFDNISLPYKLHYVWEDKSLGTAGGLKLLSGDFPKTFFVSNCDIIINADYEEIYNHHINNNNAITVIGSIRHFEIPYGVMKISNGGNLEELTEKPEHDFLVNTGMYVVQKSVLNLIPESETLHFTQLIELVRKGKGRVGVYPISEKSWLDIGQWEEYRETIKKFGI